MNPLLFLLGAVVVAAVAIGVLSYRQRRPTSMHASMREFERGLKALDPHSGGGRQVRRLPPDPASPPVPGVAEFPGAPGTDAPSDPAPAVHEGGQPPPGDAPRGGRAG